MKTIIQLFIKSMLVVAAITATTSCSSVGNVLNPYKSEFSCPLTDKGKCVDLATAYKESLSLDGSTQNSGNGNRALSQPQPESQTVETQYQSSLYRKLADMLTEPVTPMVAPPKVMRVLLLPYKGDNNSLYMFRYAYFFVDEPKWVFGSYLNTDMQE